MLLYTISMRSYVWHQIGDDNEYQDRQEGNPARRWSRSGVLQLVLGRRSMRLRPGLIWSEASAPRPA